MYILFLPEFVLSLDSVWPDGVTLRYVSVDITKGDKLSVEEEGTCERDGRYPNKDDHTDDAGFG